MAIAEALNKANKMGSKWLAPPHLCRLALKPRDTELKKRHIEKIEMVLYFQLRELGDGEQTN